MSRPIVGSFGKALDGSLSINFGYSAGPDCEQACLHHPKSTAKNPTNACYAFRSELRPDRSQLAAKLARHQRTRPETICNKALLEIVTLQTKGKTIPWVRISTNGSVPRPSKVTDRFKEAFCRLLEHCKSAGIPVHLPVETAAKARFYRSLVGGLAVVRESAVSRRRFLETKYPVSFTADGESRIESVELARQLAADRREKSGRKCVVCPAVLNSFAARRNPAMKNERAKCGACVACAASTTDIVYPKH